MYSDSLIAIPGRTVGIRYVFGLADRNSCSCSRNQARILTCCSQFLLVQSELGMYTDSLISILARAVGISHVFGLADCNTCLVLSELATYSDLQFAISARPVRIRLVLRHTEGFNSSACPNHLIEKNSLIDFSNLVV